MRVHHRHHIRTGLEDLTVKIDLPRLVVAGAVNGIAIEVVLNEVAAARPSRT
jgi:hypothetical protein